MSDGRFTADTATRTGRSERAVQLDATRGERINDDILAEIRGTDLDKGVVLDAVAKAPDPEAELRRRRASGPVGPVDPQHGSRANRVGKPQQTATFSAGDPWDP